MGLWGRKQEKGKKPAHQAVRALGVDEDDLLRRIESVTERLELLAADIQETLRETKDAE